MSRHAVLHGAALSELSSQSNSMHRLLPLLGSVALSLYR
jgi:hypothetical protein